MQATPLVLQEEETNWAALGWTIGMGAVYLLSAILPLSIVEQYYFLSPAQILLYGGVWNPTAWTSYAFYAMEWGSLGLFGTMFVLWGLAFIPSLAGIFLEAIPISIYVSYGLAAFVLTAFILGAYIQTGGLVVGVYTSTIGWNIAYGLIYSCSMIGLELLVDSLFKPMACDWYEDESCGQDDQTMFD